MPFIADSDLVTRMKNGLELAVPETQDLFYTPDKEGYADYPFVGK